MEEEQRSSGIGAESAQEEAPQLRNDRPYEVGDGEVQKAESGVDPDVEKEGLTEAKVGVDVHRAAQAQAQTQKVLEERESRKGLEKEVWG